MLIQNKIGNLEMFEINQRQVDYILMEWYEARKRILRKTTQSGKEISIKFLNENPALTEGDVLFADDTTIIAVSIKKKYRVEKLICAGVAILLATRTFAIHEIDGIGSESDPAKVSVGIGFWFWFSSFILLLIGLLAAKFLDKKMPEEKLPA